MRGRGKYQSSLVMNMARKSSDNDCKRKEKLSKFLSKYTVEEIIEVVMSSSLNSDIWS